MPRVLGGSYGGERFLMGEGPLFRYLMGGVGREEPAREEDIKKAFSEIDGLFAQVPSIPHLPGSVQGHLAHKRHPPP